jgi:hypothetical protein
MRTVVWGLVVCMVLIVALAGGGPPEAQAQRAGVNLPDRSATTDLIALSFDGGEGRQQVTLVDPRSRVMAVYHVDRTSGSLALKSVRNIAWDLQMEEFNTSNPTPREIKPLTQQR